MQPVQDPDPEAVEQVYQKHVQSAGQIAEQRKTVMMINRESVKQKMNSEKMQKA